MRAFSDAAGGTHCPEGHPGRRPDSGPEPLENHRNGRAACVAGSSLWQAGIPLVVTYHPAYLLRSPEQKAKAWQDLQQVMKIRAEK